MIECAFPIASQGQQRFPPAARNTVFRRDFAVSSTATAPDRGRSLGCSRAWWELLRRNRPSGVAASGAVRAAWLDREKGRVRNEPRMVIQGEVVGAVQTQMRTSRNPWSGRFASVVYGSAVVGWV